MRFKRKKRTWSLFVPSRLQAVASPPLNVQRQVFGRMELCIGRLGAGKTTWASVRAKRLGRDTGAHRDPTDALADVPLGQYTGRWIADGTPRRLMTTGEGWPEPWEQISSWADLYSAENAVVILDEVHLIASSTRGLMSADDEKQLIKWLSLCRKTHTCVLATTQGWTRVATHFRQLVGMVWVCEPRVPGKLHIAYPHDHPDDGGAEIWSPQWFDPAAARIATNAGAWTPWAKEMEVKRTAGAGEERARPPAASTTPPPLPANLEHLVLNTTPKTRPAPGFHPGTGLNGEDTPHARLTAHSNVPVGGHSSRG